MNGPMDPGPVPVRPCPGEARKEGSLRVKEGLWQRTSFIMEYSDGDGYIRRYRAARTSCIMECPTLYVNIAVGTRGKDFVHHGGL